MKYLWIEDFDGSSGDSKEILKSNLIKQLSIDPNDLIIKENLTDGLTFIRDNPNEFDCAILDIRFPVNDSVDDVYSEFLSDTLTEDYLQDKCEKGKGAGLLVFHYLVYKERFPIKRIAFFSANISNISNYPELIQKVLKLDDLDSQKEDLIKYARRQFESNLDEKRSEIETLNSSKEVETWVQENVISTDVEGSQNESQLTYNQAEQEFKKVGLNLSNGFAKVSGDTPNDDFFKNFTQKNNTSYVNSRRILIDMCLIIKPYLEQEYKDVNILNDYFRINEKAYIRNFFDKAYHLKLLQSVMSLPLDINDDKCSTNANRKNTNKLIQKEVFNLINPIESFRTSDIKYNYNEACVLKLARNWAAHSILEDNSYSPQFLAFISYLAFKFYFNFNKLNPKDQIKLGIHNDSLKKIFEKNLINIEPYSQKSDIYYCYNKLGKNCRDKNKKLSNNKLFECYYHLLQVK